MSISVGISAPTPPPELLQGRLFRHRAYQSHLNGRIAWGPGAPGIPTPHERVEVLYDAWRALIDVDTLPYQDVHCSTFTPASFELIVTDLKHLRLLQLDVLEIVGPNGHEFYAHLLNPPANGCRPDREHFYKRRAEIMKRAVQEAGAN